MGKLLSYRIKHPVSRHHLLSMFREIKVLESAVTSATEDRDLYMEEVEVLEKENDILEQLLSQLGEELTLAKQQVPALKPLSPP